MLINSANLPTITLDLKKQRIRIHNNTLHLLGDPPYINLLVNPDQKVLAVRATETRNPCSHKIIYNTQQDHEFYSKGLLKQLQKLYPEMEINNSYRLYGKYIPGKHLVLFEMRGMFQISGSAQEVSNDD